MTRLSGQGQDKGQLLERFRGLPKGTLVPVEAVLEALADAPVNCAQSRAEDSLQIGILFANNRAPHKIDAHLYGSIELLNSLV